MYLVINLSIKDDIHLTLFDEEKVIEKHFKGRNRELLNSIDTLLIENRLTKDNIKGIAVVVGSGGFTSTRISVVTANTFSYTQKIPVLAIEEKQTKKVQELIPALNSQKIGVYITASYSAEANIT